MIFVVPLQPGTTLANVRYRWITSGVEGTAQTTGITQPDGTFSLFRISATPPAGAEQLIVYDNTDTSNWNDGGYAERLLLMGLLLPTTMILTVPLQAGTSLANVRYKWIASGTAGSVLSTGVTQPSATYPTFRLLIAPPAGAEELVVYDVTDVTNWNAGAFSAALLTQAGGGIVSGGSLSPSLSTLRIVCAAYLRVDPSAFIVGGSDLFLYSLNSARQSAELLHDFEYSRISATLTLNGNSGGDLADAVITPADTFSGVKSVVALRRLRPNGSYIPLDFTRADIPIERERTELEFSDNLWPTRRYPSDADLLARGTASSIIQRGTKLFVYPGFTDSVDNQVSLTIEGYGWLKNYGSATPVSSDEDFIVTYGQDYLQWSVICDLNMMFQTFVPRQEGNLAPPEKQLADAWKMLLDWDSYLVDSHITRSR